MENDLDNQRTARICCIIANVNRSKKSKTFKEKDFIPLKQKEKKKKMSINQMSTILKTITIANGGEIK